MARQATHHQQNRPSWRPRAATLGASIALLVGASFGLAGIAGAASPPDGATESKGAQARPDKDSATAETSGRDRTGKAGAVPGDNGTVKIHGLRTPADDRRNEPRTCGFYLDAYGFDAAQAVSWVIRQQPPTGTAQVRAGTLVLGANGTGRSAAMILPAGHYKLIWTFAGEHGKAKHKVFWSDCGARDKNGKDKGDREDDVRCPDKAEDKAKDEATDKSKDEDKAKDEATDKSKDEDKAKKCGESGEKPGDKSGEKPGGKSDDAKGGAPNGEEGESSSEVKGAALATDDDVPPSQGDSLALTGADKTMGVFGAALMLLGAGGLMVVTGRRTLHWFRR